MTDTGGSHGAPDPLLAAMGRLRELVPGADLVPLDWAEIGRALTTVWQREMADPQKAVQTALEYQGRMVEAVAKVWTDAAASLWGLAPRPAEEEGRPRRPDRRFAAPEWEANPFYATFKETYMLASEYLLREPETGEGRDAAEERRLRFHLRQFVDAMAPVNFLLLNPTAARRAFETGGMSIVEGARNLAADVEQGRLSMVDASAFEVGRNLATTPGKVVMRNELAELIQYAPATPQVREVPLLFVPPWINKYYILDLGEGNSLVRHLVGQGFTVFMISWRNPDASMEGITFEDYMRLGPLAAAGAVCEITGSPRANPVGYCIGGTLLVMALAWLAAGEDEEAAARFGDPTFMVSLQDFADVGDTEVFMDEPQFEAMEMQMLERGYLDDRKMANMFNLLRSTDLIWANVINNYLMGQKPPALDLLYWNSDGTRMARAAHAFYIRNTYLENNLVEPGKVVLAGRAIDLGRIEADLYAVGAEKDHIVPWRSAWKITQLTGSRAPRFTLAASGHIAGMISPPARNRGYWSAPAGRDETAEAWRERAERRPGSWWEDWTEWLGERSGEHRDPPPLGSDAHPPLEDAPGTYVRAAPQPAV